MQVQYYVNKTHPSAVSEYILQLAVCMIIGPDKSILNHMFCYNFVMFNYFGR